MTNTDADLKFGALPAPTPLLVMPDDLGTLIYWARHGAGDVQNQIIDRAAQNIASTPAPVDQGDFRIKPDDLDALIKIARQGAQSLDQRTRLNDLLRSIAHTP